MATWRHLWKGALTRFLSLKHTSRDQDAIRSREKTLVSNAHSVSSFSTQVSVATRYLFLNQLTSFPCWVNSSPQFFYSQRVHKVNCLLSRLPRTRRDLAKGWQHQDTCGSALYRHVGKYGHSIMHNETRILSKDSVQSDCTLNNIWKKGTRGFPLLKR